MFFCLEAASHRQIPGAQLFAETRPSVSIRNCAASSGGRTERRSRNLISHDFRFLHHGRGAALSWHLLSLRLHLMGADDHAKLSNVSILWMAEVRWLARSALSRSMAFYGRDTASAEEPAHAAKSVSNRRELMRDRGVAEKSRRVRFRARVLAIAPCVCKIVSDRTRALLEFGLSCP